ncbi:MAG: toxin-antitoxin system YwqK family antitoxin [Bacteroidia bacterium]
MKKLYVILGIIVITVTGNAQVKQNAEGLYITSNGATFTGILENKEKGIKTYEIEIKNGLANGEATYFYSTGKIMEKGTFENGNKEGKWIRYNENGLTIGIAAYVAGKKDGTWIVWDDNGKKRFEMHYRSGEKTGTWITWNENGEQVSSKDFSRAD